MKSVYSAVRTGSLNKAACASALKGLIYWDDKSLDAQKLHGDIEFFHNLSPNTGIWRHAAGGTVG